MQPSFNYEMFEKERQRIADQIKAKKAIKEQDKERRKAILERMAQRNQELYGGIESGQNEAKEEDKEDLDYLDNEEELAMLGKRYKAAVGPVDGPLKHNEQKPTYGVLRAPESRDAEIDENTEATGVSNQGQFGREMDKQKNQSPLDLLSQKLLNKQKASGY